MRASGMQPLPGDSEASIHIPTSAVMYESALEGLTSLDQQILSTVDYPPLYQAGVRYKREPRDVWKHVVDVAAAGVGDCEDLAAWRAAELRQTGEDPGAFVYVYRSGKKRYHAVVGRGDGSVEDPSYILGMPTGRNWRPIENVGETRYPDDGGTMSTEGSEVEWAEGEDESGGGLGFDVEADDVEGDDDEGEAEPEDPEEQGADDQADPTVDTAVARRAAPARRPAPKKKKRSRGRRLWRAAKRASRVAVAINPGLQFGRALVGVGDDPAGECGDDVTFDVYKTGQGWSGVLRIPTGQGRALMMASSPSATKARATDKAVNLARLASSPALKAMVPPQARLALAMMKHPAAKQVLKRIKF